MILTLGIITVMREKRSEEKIEIREFDVQMEMCQ